MTTMRLQPIPARTPPVTTKARRLPIEFGGNKYYSPERDRPYERRGTFAPQEALRVSEPSEEGPLPCFTLPRGRVIGNRFDGDWLGAGYEEGAFLVDAFARLGLTAELLAPELGLHAMAARRDEWQVICTQARHLNGELQTWLEANLQARVVWRPSASQKDILLDVLEDRRFELVHVALDKVTDLVDARSASRAAQLLAGSSPGTLLLVTSLTEAVACRWERTVRAGAFALPARRLTDQDGRGPAFLAAFLATYWQTGKAGLALINGHANAAAVALGRGPQDYAGLTRIVREFAQLP